MHRFLVALFVVPAIGLAQGTSTSSSQLKLPLEARAAALGEAVVSDAGNLSSSIINPANIATIAGNEISFSYSSWIQDVQSEYLSVGLPLSVGGLGISIASTGVNNIEVRERPGPPSGSFSSRFVTMSVSFAASLPEGLFAGLRASYLYQKIYVDDASGYGIDMGMGVSDVFEGMSLGASLVNVGKLGAFRSSSSDLPILLRFGGSYRLHAGDFTFTAYPSYSRELKESSSHALLGGEIQFRDLVAFRIGYQSGYSTRGFSAGIGLAYGFASLDYGYVPFAAGLGDAHIASFQIRF